MKTKILGVIALVLILAISGIANADSVPVVPLVGDVQVQIEQVKINGDVLNDDEVRGEIIRGENVEVEVKILALADDNNVVIEATVKGIDHDSEKASDEIDAFKVEAGKTYYKTLNIELPNRMDIDTYSLRIEVSNRYDNTIVYNADLDIDSERNSMRIKDVIFSPENQVKAGRALLTTVRMQNSGENDEEDVKVNVAIPELGLSVSDYIDEVEAEDSITSEELYMRIPECANAGVYTAVVTLTFDDGDESVSEEHTINVVESETCSASVEGKVAVTVSNDVQEVAAGDSGVVYPVTLTNTGAVAKTLTISAKNAEWADITVNPNVVVLNAGETKTVYVTVAASEDAELGTQTFDLAIKSGNSAAKEVTLKANVTEGAAGWNKVKRGLEVALVVLVVLLVIIGLIVGFNRLKGDEEEDFKEETYY